MQMLSRRQALSTFALAATSLAGGLLLSACSSAAPASPTAAPAATSAPATAATPAPTQPAAAPTAAPTTAATPAPTQAAAAPTVAPTAAQAATTSGPASVDLWYGHPEWKEGMTGVLATFNKVVPNVTVNAIASTEANKLQTALNAGIGPDLFQHPSRPTFDVMVAAGQVMELDHKVDTSAWTQVAVDAETVKGKIWGVPGGKYTVGIAYHIDLFDKAGISGEPKTWADMTAAFEKLKAINVVPYSIAIKDGSLSYFNYIGLASSVLGLNGFNSVVSGDKKLTDPELVAVIQQMMDWSKYYQPNSVGTVYLESKALFATAKAAAMDAGSSDYNGYLQINPNAKLGFMYWPAPDAQHQPCTNTGMEFQVGVNAKAKFGDAAVSFVNWLGTTAGGQAMTDNIKDLSVLKGVTTTNPLQQKMLATPLDVPVWYERFSTQNVGQVWSDKGQAPFQGKMTAAEMAKLLQDSVDKGVADAAKQ